MLGQVDTYYNSSFKPAIEFPYKLDDYQLKGIESIEREENILITAHTGAGKSTFAEYAIACAARDNKKIIYTSPIKTLSNQKFSDFKNNRDKYGLEDTDIGILTGDHKINPDAQCCVMTTEILRNQLYKSNDYFDDVKYVVFDEVHYFNDKDRGHVWEECIIMLPLHIILIKLSATIDKAQEFSDWVSSIRNRKTNLISTPFRPVPLLHYVLIPYSNKLINYSEKDCQFNNNNYAKAIEEFTHLKKGKKFLNSKHIFNPLVEFLNARQLLPVLCFVFSRKKCQEYANTINISLVDHEERRDIEKIFDYYIRKLVETKENIEQIMNVKDLVMKGIGVHHSGMIPVLKEIIEVLFGHKDENGKPKPLIKVLFATETFAVGVNMPTKTTVFTDLTKFDTNGMRNLYSHEYTQMSGRAGRRGFDKFGNVIYYPIKDIEPVHSMRNIVINKPETLTSKFLINVKFIMKGLKSKDQDIKVILGKSLLNNENNKTKVLLQNANKDVGKELESEKNKLNVYNKNDITLVEEYIEFSNKMEALTGKQRKKLYNEFNNLKERFESCKQSKYIMEIFNNVKSKEYELFKNNKDIQNINNSNNYEIEKLIDFLKKYSYIDNNNDITSDNIKYDNITLKGIITSEFNEANELLMTEMIQSGIFKDVDQIELLTILSIFCEDFDKDNYYYLGDLVISENCKKKLKEIQNIHNNLLYSTDEFNIQYNHKYSFQFADIVWLWCNNKTFSEIIKDYEIFEGNFIKNMQKIYNITQELNEVAEILQDHGLLKKIQNIENLIIKDIVNSKSLYLI
jgi:superfamily II RNA helicase